MNACARLRRERDSVTDLGAIHAKSLGRNSGHLVISGVASPFAARRQHFGAKTRCLECILDGECDTFLSLPALANKGLTPDQIKILVADIREAQKRYNDLSARLLFP